MTNKEITVYHLRSLINGVDEFPDDMPMITGHMAIVHSNLAILEALEQGAQGPLWVIAEDETPVNLSLCLAVEVGEDAIDDVPVFWVRSVLCIDDGTKVTSDISHMAPSKARAEFLREHIGKLLTAERIEDRPAQTDLRRVLAEWDRENGGAE